jgi:voltage-gated potassium channel
MAVHDVGVKHPMLLALVKKLELPMLFLSFVWLFVLIAELVQGMNPVLHGLGTSIWILFILYLSLRLMAVVDRVAFLKKNWLFVLAILASVLRFFPFMQPFPIVRALTATFGMQVIWIFASVDQGMRSIRRALGRRGTGYALALTLVVLFVGAAGMLYFERVAEFPQGIHTYSRALWWTAMQMTNIGTSYSPWTRGGRILCLGISVHAAAMFGYLTAMLATLFIDREAKDPKSEIASQKSILAIHEEIIQLRRIIEGAMSHLSRDE